MAVSNAVQPLISAFSFGIVTNGAAAAAAVFLRPSASSLFHDSQRLALTIFLISAALWALIAFIGLAVNSSSGCQVAIVFTTAFDQIARIAFAQFLLWAMTGGSKRSWATFVPQTLLVLRFVLGGVYVGFQRAQFAPVCFSSTRVLPLGASILGVDAIILSILLITFRTGSSNGTGRLQVNADRAKVLLLGVAGAAFWTVLSAPMLLGIRSLDLFLRTVLPCIGLVVLISMTILAKSQLLANSNEDKLYPNLDDTRQYRMSDLVRDMANRPSLQMSVARRDSKVSKSEAASVRVTALNKPPNRNKALPGINGPVPGQVETGIGGLPVAGQLFPPTKSGNTVDSRYIPPQGSPMSRDGFKKTKYAKKSGHLISGPVLREDSPNPLDKVATVDLMTAARQDQERRAVQTRPLKSRTSGASSSAATAEEWTSRTQRSGVPSAARTHLVPVVESAVTSSAQPSPGLDDLRRRSPRLAQHVAFQQTPIVPLKTRGTLSASKADVWDLLAVPNGEPPVVPPRSPLRQQQQPSTSPAVKAIATMPSAPSERQRSQPRQPRASRSKDLKIDTSSRLPPVSNDNNKDSYAFAQQKRSEAPPPYQIDYQAHRSPKTPALEAFVAPPAIVETRSSPKLSLFPPPPTKKAASPRQDSPTAMDVSLAPAKPRTYKGLEALPQTDGTFATQTVMLLDDVEYRDSIMTTLVASRKSSPIRESVLDRPRPVTRTPEAAHFLHAHGRSQSCGSVLTRESSFFQQAAGDPSSLPPLPPIPISKSPLFNGLLGHAKSATVDERLFRTGMGRRRSRSLTANVPTTIPSARSSMSTAKTNSLLSMADLTGHSEQEARIEEQSATNTLDNVALETSPVPSLRGTATPDEELSETSSFDTGVAESPFLDQYSPSITPRQHSFSPPESPAKMTASKTMLDNDMWRRLGAPCPTFSNRPAFSRRQPPPNPLPLYSSVNTVVVETEPSPLESPDHALREIEAQLQRLERSSRVSSVDQMQRMTLLAELEQEIDGQETQWQAMRHTIIRDSLSTVGVSPHQAKEVASLWAKVRRDRDSHLTVDTCLSARSASPEPLRRLAVPGSRVSHLTLSPLQLGSPTPPDTDSDMGDEIPVMLAQAVQLARQPAVSLWRAEAASPLLFKYTACLWSPSEDRSLVLPEVLPVSTARPTRRRTEAPLEIDSQQLWTKAKKYTPIRRGGLWKPMSPAASTASPSAAATPSSLPALAPVKRSASLPSRPSSAVKPIRKSKRISALPDILESPRLHPVRHTLGLFSFPWGETSDSAYPALYQNAIPGTMSTGLDRVFDFPTATPQDDAQRTFFEECDEEDYGDNFQDMDDYDGFGSDDDEVDQEMLWEIAGMLKGEGFHLVPSGVQLPSQVPREAPESKAHVQSAIDEAISEQLVALTAKAELWQPASHLRKVVEKQVGLEQPDQGAWRSYVDSAAVQRGARRRVEKRESLSDDVYGRLWMPRHDIEQQFPNGPTLWTSPDGSRAPSPSCSIDSATKESSQTEGQLTSNQLIQTPGALWSLPLSTQPQTPASQTASLWVSPLSLPPSLSEDFWARSSTSHVSPLPTSSHETPRCKRTLPATLPEISTCALWLPEQETVASPDWIVRHAAKPKAPSSKLWSRVDLPAKPKPSSDGLWLPHALPPPEEEYTLQPRSSRRPAMTQVPFDLVSDQAPCTLWIAEQEKVTSPDWMVRHTTISKTPSSKLWSRVDQPAKSLSRGLWLPHALPPPEEEYTLQPRSCRRPAMTQAPLDLSSDQVFDTLWLPKQEKATTRPDWMARHTANPNHSQPEPAPLSKLWSKIDQPAKPLSDGLWLPHALPPVEEEYTLQPRSSRRRPAVAKAPVEHFNTQGLWAPAEIRYSGEGTRGWLI